MERQAAERSADADGKEEEDAATEDSGIEVEYVQEKPLVDITNPLYSQFHKIFEAFRVSTYENSCRNKNNSIP